ncbi:hypothetical protein MPTK2_2g11620 [Marchantia polymorpha subsp. ruderalis]
MVFVPDILLFPAQGWLFLQSFLPFRAPFSRSMAQCVELSFISTLFGAYVKSLKDICPKIFHREEACHAEETSILQQQTSYNPGAESRHDGP